MFFAQGVTFSLRLIWAAAISTALIITLGVVLIAPLFIRLPKPENRQRVLLCFSVLDSSDASEWCSNLSSVLELHSVKAAVFFVGKVAEQHPECVSTFSNNVDIGSQTYSYTDLRSISNYGLQLEEVKKGKRAVDDAGNLYSRLFRAPYGSTDENIYSLLSRSDIVADFSYEQQYNVYENGKFIKFDAVVYNSSDFSIDNFQKLPKNVPPIIIFFESSFSTAKIEQFVSELQAGNIEFISASELVGCDLTTRGG
jgi:peptidoglycan/xylan/chitin deacetylase (PgdA/CDA1 family)